MTIAPNSKQLARLRELVTRSRINIALDFRFLFAFNEAVSLKLYLVTCDLFQAGDYASLRARLRTFEARPVLDNQWALHSTYTAAQLKDLLKAFLHEGDRIVVTEVGAERASRRALSNLAEL